MALGADLVARAFLLLSGRQLSPEEAEAKAELLESKQELLAHLVLRAGVFEKEPELRELLRPSLLRR